MTKQEKYHIKLKEQREAQYEMISLTITKNIKGINGKSCTYQLI